MLWFGCLLLGSTIGTAVSLEVKIGLLMTTKRCCDYLSVEDKASALTIAVDRLYKDGVLNNATVTFK